MEISILIDRRLAGYLGRRAREKVDEIEYRAEIRAAYVGELGGAATAAALAARADFTADQQTKIEALGRLERHVAHLLQPVLVRLQLEVGATDGIEAAARSRAAAIADWPMLIGQFGERLRPYIDRFDRLLANAAPQDLSALQVLAEHEHALAAFGLAEAAGQGDRSILHLTRLLSQPCSSQD